MIKLNLIVANVRNVDAQMKTEHNCEDEKCNCCTTFNDCECCYNGDCDCNECEICDEYTTLPDLTQDASKNKK